MFLVIPFYASHNPACCLLCVLRMQKDYQQNDFVQADFGNYHITLDTSPDLHVYVGVDLFQYVCVLTVDQTWL